MPVTFYPTVSFGELGKYAQIQRALLPASSWAAPTVRKFGHVPNKIKVPRIPECMMEASADCGGFVATRKWGGYRYTVEQYVEWLSNWKQAPIWAATMDYCCESPITGGDNTVVRERQQRTTEMAHHFWQEYRSVSWAWVPTIQGWEVEDYQKHARELRILITEMQSHYGTDSAFRVGIGTLCARASVATIHDVVRAVSAIIPGVPLHLWGVKLGLLQSPIALPQQVVSIDSGAWNGLFRTGRNAWKESGLSQRQWCFNVALPAYEAKIAAAQSQNKQLSLW